MRCKDFIRLLDPFLDRELAQDQEARFLKHKDQCPQCKQAYEIRMNLFTMMDSAQELPWTIDITGRVMGEIASQQVPETASPYKLPLLIAACFGICVFIAVFLLGTFGIMGHHAVTDSVKMLVSIIELPVEIQQSLNELISFFKGTWIAVSAAGGFLGKSMMTILSIILVLSIPLFALVVLVIWGFRRSKIRKIHAVF